MLPFADVNLLAVVVATIAALIVGFIWYGPLFGQAWMTETGINKSDAKKDMGKTMTKGIINTLVLTYVLGLLMVLIAPSNMQDALAFGLIIWLGLIATTEASSVIWAKGSWKLFLINTSHELIVVLIAVSIFMTWPA